MTEHAVIVGSQGEPSPMPSSSSGTGGAVIRVIAARALSAVTALVGTVTIVFVALDLTGPPVELFLSASAGRDDYDDVLARLGYDSSLVERYIAFVGQVVTGRFPDSLQYGLPAMDVVLQRVPATAQLAGVSLGVAVVLGLSFGYLAAFGRLRTVTALIRTYNSVLLSLPVFVVGFGLILLFSIEFGWLPPGGGSDPLSIVLPAVALGTVTSVPVASVFETSLRENAERDFVRAARANGRTERSVRLVHIVPNSMLPVLNVVGMSLGGLLGGSIIVENLFRWPGLGMVMTTATQNQDYPVIVASVLVAAAAFVATSFLVDLLQIVFDPRLRSRA